MPLYLANTANTFRCLLINGQGEYISCSMAYLRDGDILTCCSTAKDDIKLATYR